MSEPIHLKTREKPNDELEYVAWMATLLGLILGIAEIRRGEFPTSFFVIVGLAIAVVLLMKKWRESLRNEYFAVLYEDSMTVSNFGEKNRVVHWDQVKKLRWIPSGEGELIVYTDEIKIPFGSFSMDLEELTPVDRLVFLKHVRIAAASVKQERWPYFCRSVAVPLLEKLQKNDKPEEQVENTETWQDKFYAKLLSFTLTSPFMVRLLVLPVLTILSLPMLLRRKTWWTIAALLTLSSLINIRLIWGEWAQPFTTMVLGTAAVCFVSGFLTPRQSLESHSRATVSSLVAILYLVVILVLSPIPLNALARGWISKNWTTTVLLGTYGLLFLIPLALLARGIEQEGKMHRELLEQEAMSRWEKEIAYF